MAFLETVGDYRFADCVASLNKEVKSLRHELSEMKEINDNLCKINNTLYQAICEQNDLVREMLRRNN